MLMVSQHSPAREAGGHLRQPDPREAQQQVSAAADPAVVGPATRRPLRSLPASRPAGNRSADTLISQLPTKPQKNVTGRRGDFERHFHSTLSRSDSLLQREMT